MIFIIFLCFMHISFAALSEKNIIFFSDDILATIISRPDTQACNEITKEHFQQYGNNKQCKHDYIAVKKALFPCYNLTLTCKTLNDITFKKKMLNLLQIHLQKMFQPGISLFLVPLELQKKINPINNDTSIKQIIDLLYETIDKEKNLSKEVIEVALTKELKDLTILHSLNYELRWPNETCAYFSKVTIFELLFNQIINSIASRKRTGNLPENAPLHMIIQQFFPHFFYFLHKAIEQDSSFLSLPACSLRKTTIMETEKHYNGFGLLYEKQAPKNYYHQQTIGHWLKTNEYIQACLKEANDNPEYFKVIQESLENFNEDTKIKISEQYSNNPQEHQILTDVISLYLDCHQTITNTSLIFTKAINAEEKIKFETKQEKEKKEQVIRKEKFQYCILFLIKYVFFPIIIFIFYKIITRKLLRYF